MTTTTTMMMIILFTIIEPSDFVSIALTVLYKIDLKAKHKVIP